MRTISASLAEDVEHLPVLEVVVDRGSAELPQALPPCRCPCGWQCTCG